MYHNSHNIILLLFSNRYLLSPPLIKMKAIILRWPTRFEDSEASYSVSKPQERLGTQVSPHLTEKPEINMTFRYVHTDKIDF